MNDQNNTARFNIRIPREIDNWLVTKAASNHRSKNGEIISLLEAFKRQDEQAKQQ